MSFLVKDRDRPQPLLSSGWTRLAKPPVVPPDAEVYWHQSKRLLAIRSIDGGRWHLSVSHTERIPTWGELGFARDHLLPPDVWLMVPHPPRQYWLNIHRHVLHLWEFSDQTLIEQFKMEGELAQRRGLGSPDDGEKRR